MAHALLDRFTRGLRGETDAGDREAFDRAAEERYAQLLGEGLSGEELRALHRKASVRAPVRKMHPQH